MRGFEANIDGDIESSEPFIDFDEVRTLLNIFDRQGWEPRLISAGRGGYYRIAVRIDNRSLTIHTYLKKVTPGSRENRPYEKRIQFSAALDRVGFDQRKAAGELMLLLGIYKRNDHTPEILCAWNVEDWGANIGRVFNCYVDIRAIAKSHTSGIVRYRTSIGQVAYCFKEEWLPFYLFEGPYFDRGENLPQQLDNSRYRYDANGLLQGLPRFEYLAPLVFEMLKSFQLVSVDEMESYIASRLQLPIEVRSAPHNLKEGNRTELGYRLAWARNYLKRSGLIESPKRSLWKLTDVGRTTDIVDPSEIIQLIRMTNEETHRDLEVDYLYEIQTDPDNGDVEFENTESIDYNIEHPFDPSKVDIKTRTMSMDLILKRLDRDEIDLNTSFQRKANLWDSTKQSRLVESILIRFPLPAFYFDGSDDDNWLVVDGLQRLSTLDNFVNKKLFALQNLEFLNQFNGLKFNDLPGNLQRRLEEFEITAYIISPGTPKKLKYIVFKRINTGGLILTSQEIRNALNQGPPAEFIKKLAGLRSFKKATSFSIREDRMLDREFITRFFSFYAIPYHEYHSDLDSFLNLGMELIYTLPQEELELATSRFDKAMLACIKIFGEDAFRKRYRTRDKRKPINKALFEVWAVTLSRLEDRQIDILVRHKMILKHGFMNLLNTSPDFNKSISSGTGDRSRVRKRFEEIEKLVNSILVEFNDQ